MPALGRLQNMSQNEPITCYSETTLTGRRRYELSQDRILIKGSVSGSYDYERTFELTKLNPEYITLRIRPLVTWIALITCIMTGFASLLLVYEFPIRSAAVPGVLGIYSGSALIVAIATFRKVEYARFCSDDYRAVLFSIARSGPDKNHFDSFVQALVDRIVMAKHAAQQ
jgi:hypothetical protein